MHPAATSMFSGLDRSPSLDAGSMGRDMPSGVGRECRRKWRSSEDVLSPPADSMAPGFSPLHNLEGSASYCAGQKPAVERPPRSPLVPSSRSRQRSSLSPVKSRRSSLQSRHPAPQRPTRLDVPDTSPTPPGGIVVLHACKMPVANAYMGACTAPGCHAGATPLRLAEGYCVLKAPSTAARRGRRRCRSGSVRSPPPAQLDAGRSAMPSCRCLLPPPTLGQALF